MIQLLIISLINLEDTSIGETSNGSRVSENFNDALSRGMANWKISAVGKLIADGELLPKAAERASKFCLESS